jgi:ribosomal subunit interface protein
MELIFKNRNGKISERQREHIETKLDKLSRFFDQIKTLTVEISTGQAQDMGEFYRVQATLVGERGVILRADQRSQDMYTAVDMVQDVLERQIKRYKDKHWRRGRMRRKGGEFVASETLAPAPPPEPEEEADTNLDHQIVRVKEFALTPMYSDEAVEQMELLDHTFFVYRDADTERVSIVYRRHDGNYGLLIPNDEAEPMGI